VFYKCLTGDGLCLISFRFSLLNKNFDTVVRKTSSELNSGVPMNFVRWAGSTNSVKDRGQRERGSGGGSPWSGILQAALIWYKKFHFI